MMHLGKANLYKRPPILTIGVVMHSNPWASNQYLGTFSYIYIRYKSLVEDIEDFPVD